MKKVILSIAITAALALNAQGNSGTTTVSKDNKTGIRITNADPNNHGDIGDKAVDLSYSDSASGIRGATGDHATALGLNTTASGTSSTAMGSGTIAIGNSSTATGYNTIASGDSSTATGYNTIASDYGSLVIGRHNNFGSSVTNGGSATEYSANNTAFVIGNGTDADNKSDAFTVRFNGNANLAGTLTAGSFAGSFVGDGSQLTGVGILTPVNENGTGYRLSTSNAENHGNIGEKAVDLSYSNGTSGTRGATGVHAIAMGFNTTASEIFSTAMGCDTTASDQRSTAMGHNTTASGYGSTAMGGYTIASGTSSTAMGSGTIASGSRSTAMGDGTTASGSRSTAMGDGTTASGSRSTAMGQNTRASGTSSTAMGYYTTASGTSSTAMGYDTTASDYGSLVIGRYNSLGSSVSSNGSATSYNANNTAFVIGNGTAADNKSDAFTVMFNGDVTLAGNLAVNSDARLKANIISLGGTLSKLLKIDGKKYTKKKDKNQKLNIGVLAQDIEKVFPELVSESNGIKSVNYQGLVPVLINALKEQDSRMKDQETKLNKQQEEINELKAIVKKLL